MNDDIDIKRLRLIEGDSVVITAPGPVNLADAERIIAGMTDHLERAGHGSVPILFLADGITISILSPAPRGPLEIGGGIALL